MTLAPNYIHSFNYPMLSTFTYFSRVYIIVSTFNPDHMLHIILTSSYLFCQLCSFLLSLNLQYKSVGFIACFYQLTLYFLRVYFILYLQFFLLDISFFTVRFHYTCFNSKMFRLVIKSLAAIYIISINWNYSCKYYLPLYPVLYVFVTFFRLVETFCLLKSSLWYFLVLLFRITLAWRIHVS